MFVRSWESRAGAPSECEQDSLAVMEDEDGRCAGLTWPAPSGPGAAATATRVPAPAPSLPAQELEEMKLWWPLWAHRILTGSCSACSQCSGSG